MDSNDKAILYIVVSYEDRYVQPLIEGAIHSRLPQGSYEIVRSFSEVAQKSSRILQICAYEVLEFDLALRNPLFMVNSFVIRKALIRKHFLSNTVSNWVTKYPQSLLSSHAKQSVDFELDYAEFLDDALIEAYELRDSLALNEEKSPEDRQWWILKPSMSDRGQGIRLFSLESELTNIFEEWEEDETDSEEETVTEPAHDDHADHLNHCAATDQSEGKVEKDYIVTSQLRHFVAQEYIHPPLLISLPVEGTPNPKKFHIRAYVLAAGALRVYVYKRMLALFSAVPYSAPWQANSTELLKAHLTNTCLQDSDLRDGSVCEFWSLPEVIPHTARSNATKSGFTEDWRTSVYDQVCAVTGEVFEAAARGMMVHFQPMPNAFEVYGLDFLVDDNLAVYLLEVNSFPDFKQTGEDLKEVVQCLWEEVMDAAVKPFFGFENSAGRSELMTKVCDIDLGRR